MFEVVIISAAASLIFYFFLLIFPKLNELEIGLINYSSKKIFRSSNLLFRLVIVLAGGISFGFIYFNLWIAGVGTNNYLWGSIFGALHGTLIILIYISFAHQLIGKEYLTGSKLWVAGEIASHIVYANSIVFFSRFAL